MKRTWFIGIPVFFFVVLPFLNGLFTGGSTGTTPPKAAATAGTTATQTQSTTAGPDKEAAGTAPAEEVLEVTASDLLGSLDQNALKASTTYLNKKVHIQGKLSNIDASGKYFSMSGKDFSFQSVRLDIKPEHHAAVSEFKAGQVVKATGKVTSVGEVFGYAIEVESIG